MSFMATYNSVKYKSFTELLLTWSTKSPNWILLEMKEPAYNKDVFKQLQELNKMKNISSVFRFYCFFSSFSTFLLQWRFFFKTKIFVFFHWSFFAKGQKSRHLPWKKIFKIYNFSHDISNKTEWKSFS